MSKPSFPNDRSDNNDTERQDDTFEPYPDPPGTDHEPRMTRKGDTFFPRTLWGLLWDGKVNNSEFSALVFLLDQTDGWPVLNRTWVKLTNQQWAKALNMSTRNARRIYQSLLEKNLIRRKREGRGYVYQICLPERDQREKRVQAEARRILGSDKHRR